jgi:Holliday junction resolvase RusA-like endonuclease
MSYKFSLPVYYTKKTRKGYKTFLVGLNWYRNAHYQEANKVKKYYHELIKSILSPYNGDKLTKYRIKYKLFYKNSISDLNNYVVIDKFLNDALKEIRMIEDDNVNYLKKISLEVAEQDKENPRLEIELEEIE